MAREGTPLVLFDKTGTLTRGKPELTDLRNTSAMSDAELLSLVASVEQESEHPVGRALASGALARGASLRLIEDFRTDAGHGVEARVEDRMCTLARPRGWRTRRLTRLCTKPSPMSSLPWAAPPRSWPWTGKMSGVVAVADQIAPGARATIELMKQSGIEVAMVTGDRRGSAEAIAKELGITEIFAEVRPEEKARVVAEARGRGRIVAMVGDGINDAPALAGAHVGIAVGSGTDMAVAAADIALLHGGITQLPTALRLARRTLGTIRQNLFWAFVYNVVGIPIAAGALVPITGWTLSPVLASLAMSLSSVSVLLNSLRLKRFSDRAPRSSQLAR
jgi:P-type Cu+ transporter